MSRIIKKTKKSCGPSQPTLPTSVIAKFYNIFIGSVVEWLMRCFLGDQDREVSGSTRALVTLWRPWKRRLKMLISAWWSSRKQQIEVDKIQATTGTVELETS